MAYIEMIRPSWTASPRLLVAAFTASVCGSAFLLFSVQPMIARMLLPQFGGSPAIWNTCVLFFQAALLLGYLYAHLSATRLRPRNQVLLHGGVLLAGLAFLPFTFVAAAPPSWLSPPLWLLAQLALTVGVPFAAISTTAPMVQSWFARTSHGRASDPYFLYAASNTGSLVALLLYPVLIETTLGIGRQRLLWTAGYVLVAGGVGVCGAMMLASRAAAPPVMASFRAQAAASAPGLRRQLRWVGLAFIPSALMLAVTTYITADVASAPLFWVVPLAIYIATFMLAFGRRQRTTPAWLRPAQAVFLVLAAGMGLAGASGLLLLGVSLAISLSAFAATAALCHLELARDRPDVAHLTRFFLLISVGGVLGGLVNGLVAPMLFNGPWEYPILLLAAAVFRPSPPSRARAAPADKPRLMRLIVLLALFAAAVVWAGTPYAPPGIRQTGQTLWIILPALASLLVFRGGRSFGAGIAGLLLLAALEQAHGAELFARSFFGSYRVIERTSEQLTLLQHGTTVHGAQGMATSEAAIPTTYYHPGGSFGRLMQVMDARMPASASVNVLGLGTGALSCYARPGETWQFREIDPVVERLARDDRHFHFMQRCGAAADIILGDARLTLAATDQRYDLIILDVFTSDSVPVHLLTQEALAVYFAHLKPGGIVAFHVTNRYLQLVPVVARLAASMGAAARHIAVPAPQPETFHASRAELVVVALPGGNLDDFAANGWDQPSPGSALWTDDKSDIYSIIRW